MGILSVAVSVVFWATAGIACTNLLVGPDASSIGSTFVTYSCDGGVFSAIRIEPARIHAPGSFVDILGEPPFGTLQDAALAEVIGTVPQPLRTARYLDVLAGPAYAHVGGMNEYGVAIAETTLLGAREELTNPLGLLAPFAGQPERSLMTLALQRATTAREAVTIIGSLAEEYGYHSLYPLDGEQFAISDGREVWSMEIFGPGPDWTPTSGQPGAVWCAQRVPDNHVGVSANRSRIGEIDLENPDFFLASSNVMSLAATMGWWDPDAGDPFVWYAAYAPTDSAYCSIREWRALDLVAPSHALPLEDGRFPFSVPVDKPLGVDDVMAVQRDMLEGTVYDVTEDPMFSNRGFALACPMCAPSYYELLDLSPQRTINSRYASHTCLFQAHDEWPAAVRGCTWFGFGPAATTCYVPIYSGVTELPEDWGDETLQSYDQSAPFWTMLLPGALAQIQWPSAYADIQQVRDPAERSFIEEQVLLVTRDGPLTHDQWAAELNRYTTDRMRAVAVGFDALASYLLAKYYTVAFDALAIERPTIALP